MKTVVVKKGDILPEGICYSIFCQGTGKFRIGQFIPREVSGFPGRQIKGVFPIYSHCRVESTGDLSLLCLLDPSVSPDTIPSQHYAEFASNQTELKLNSGTIKRIDLIATDQELDLDVFTLRMIESISVKMDSSLVQATFKGAFPLGVGTKIEDYVQSYAVNIPISTEIAKCLCTNPSSNHRIGLVIENSFLVGNNQSGIGMDLFSGAHTLKMAKPVFISRVRFIGSAGTTISLFSRSMKIVFPSLVLTDDLADLNVDLPPLVAPVEELLLKTSDPIYFEVGIND